MYVRRHNVDMLHNTRNTKQKARTHQSTHVRLALAAFADWRWCRDFYPGYVCNTRCSGQKRRATDKKKRELFACMHASLCIYFSKWQVYDPRQRSPHCVPRKWQFAVKCEPRREEACLVCTRVCARARAENQEDGWTFFFNRHFFKSINLTFLTKTKALLQKVEATKDYS